MELRPPSPPRGANDDGHRPHTEEAKPCESEPTTRPRRKGRERPADHHPPSGARSGARGAPAKPILAERGPGAVPLRSRGDRRGATVSPWRPGASSRPDMHRFPPVEALLYGRFGISRSHASSGSRPSAERPPSTGKTAPLTKLASSESRYATASATSLGRPTLPTGCRRRISPSTREASSGF